MRLLLALLSILAFTAAALPAHPARSLPRSESRSESTARRSERPRSTACADCERDSTGRIKRSGAATREFRLENPCPATGRTADACPGYQIDHRVPLHEGGADEASNMQWLTADQHRAKTAAERR